ncbi:hypothetical protein WN51_13975 [Melipona quadrifasciata]|uniref:Uncharacterized protein n=1 Tax=Melipona quadrifasciata TaxID=166423 RepID=A0A0M8ZZ63_9HYME|nr:hypothetical protein WN51_13975 [Melipona quadrifasciata]
MQSVYDREIVSCSCNRAVHVPDSAFDTFKIDHARLSANFQSNLTIAESKWNSFECEQFLLSGGYRSSRNAAVETGYLKERIYICQEPDSLRSVGFSPALQQKQRKFSYKLALKIELWNVIRIRAQPWTELRKNLETYWTLNCTFIHVSTNSTAFSPKKRDKGSIKTTPRRFKQIHKNLFYPPQPRKPNKSNQSLNLLTHETSPSSSTNQFICQFTYNHVPIIQSIMIIQRKVSQNVALDWSFFTILVVQVSISLSIWKRRVKSGVKSGGLREKDSDLNENCKIKRDISYISKGQQVENPFVHASPARERLVLGADDCHKKSFNTHISISIKRAALNIRVSSQVKHPGKCSTHDKTKEKSEDLKKLHDMYPIHNYYIAIVINIRASNCTLLLLQQIHILLGRFWENSITLRYPGYAGECGNLEQHDRPFIRVFGFDVVSHSFDVSELVEAFQIQARLLPGDLRSKQIAQLSDCLISYKQQYAPHNHSYRLNSAAIEFEHRSHFGGDLLASGLINTHSMCKSSNTLVNCNICVSHRGVCIQIFGQWLDGNKMFLRTETEKVVAHFWNNGSRSWDRLGDKRFQTFQKPGWAKKRKEEEEEEEESGTIENEHQNRRYSRTNSFLKNLYIINELLKMVLAKVTHKREHASYISVAMKYLCFKEVDAIFSVSVRMVYLREVYRLIGILAATFRKLGYSLQSEMKVNHGIAIESIAPSRGSEQLLLFSEMNRTWVQVVQFLYTLAVSVRSERVFSTTEKLLISNTVSQFCTKFSHLRVNT